MKTRLTLLAALLGATTLPLTAATTSATDPVPNVYDESSGDPLSGGIGYSWTVSLGAADQASLTGVVGAWSWDEDSFTGTAKGWTHTSGWIALTLAARSRVTIRLARQANIVDPYASVPGTLAGDNLFPAFTLYSGWDGDGGDSHTYNNRGNIDWAEDVTYLTHVETTDTGIVTLTVDLPAGRYTVALGGNSPATTAEGRQGYLATLSTAILDRPAVISPTKRRLSSTKTRYVLSGRVRHPEAVSKVRYQIHGRSRAATFTGDRWKATLNLQAGQNLVSVWTVDADGRTSRRVKFTLLRR